MIENLKSRLLEFVVSRRVRLGAMALLTAVSIALSTLLGCSIHTVEIFDGKNKFVFNTFTRDTSSVMSGLALATPNYNIISTSVNGSKTKFEIAYSYPVYVTCGDKTVEIEFNSGTVADALKLAGYTADNYDFVQPSLDTEISSTAYIDYTDIGYVDGSYTEAIPYTTKTVYSANTDKGVTSLSGGQNGVIQVNYTDKLVNGVVTERTVTSSAVLAAPVEAVKTVGTKVAVAEKKQPATSVKTSADVKSISTLAPAGEIELDANGNPVNYKSKMTVRATAYTYTGNNCSTGVAPQPGYIAVNPKVIPYGTKMYIKSPDGSIIYGYAVAADTGGFIKKHPTGVDLFMTTVSACTSFGVRNMEIYILE